MPRRVTLRGLYALTPDGLDSAALLEKTERALDGGVALLQYRRKRGNAAEAGRIAELARRYGVPLVVNDDPDLALAVGAQGVHVGRDDAAVSVARARLSGGIVGASCYDRVALARAAVAAGADYVAFGSVYPSPTKPAAPRAALSLFEEARALGVPLAAIGGVTLQNAPEVIAAGADLLAVISDLFDAPDIRARARQYGKLFE